MHDGNCYSKKHELFSKLVEKTRELGRQVTFDEMRNDPKMPPPNDLAFFYGSFTMAAEKAYRQVRFGKGNAITTQRGIRVMGKKTKKEISPERKEAIINELVDMYIAADGVFPSDRAIKKNNFISAEEVSIMRREGTLTYRLIRTLAEKKTGRKFSSLNERHRKHAKEATRTHWEEERKKIEEEKVETAKKTEMVKTAKAVERTEETKMERRTNGKKAYGPGEVEKIFREFCQELGHIPSQTEVNAEPKCPGWNTLQKALGPWYTWSDKYGMAFLNEKSAKKAEELKVKYKVKTEEKPEVEEEPEVEETPEVEEKPEVEPETKEESETKTEENKVFIETPELMEIPITVVVPKGLTGTFSFSFELKGD